MQLPNCLTYINLTDLIRHLSWFVFAGVWRPCTEGVLWCCWWSPWYCPAAARPPPTTTQLAWSKGWRRACSKCSAWADGRGRTGRKWSSPTPSSSSTASRRDWTSTPRRSTRLARAPARPTLSGVSRTKVRAISRLLMRSFLLSRQRECRFQGEPLAVRVSYFYCVGC